MLRRGVSVLVVAMLWTGSAAADEGLDCVDQPDPTAIGFTTICAGQQTFSDEQLQDWSCEDLWDLRSNILYTEGYCFETERGKKAFDNTGCSSKTLSAVPLNEHQRANVDLVSKLEKQKACPAD